MEVIIPLHDEKQKVISLNRLLTKLDETKKLVYHWYQSSGDTVLSSGIEQNIDRFWKRIILNRNDGAFIQVTLVVNKDMKTTDKSLQEFIEALFPMIAEYWPIEKGNES